MAKEIADAISSIRTGNYVQIEEGMKSLKPYALKNTPFRMDELLKVYDLSQKQTVATPQVKRIFNNLCKVIAIIYEEAIDNEMKLKNITLKF